MKKFLKENWLKYGPAIKKELPKLLLQGLFSGIGFLVALWVNSLVANKNEAAVYQSMLKSIRAEANSNGEILSDSVFKYYRAGLVVREYSTASAALCLSSPLFAKHAKASDLEMISKYIRVLSLSNGYRRVSEAVILSDESARKKWLDPIQEEWTGNIEESGELIDQIVKMK
ncbi:MAG: hypothetical protein ACJ71W_10825 [Terriglobales bacterium]